MKLVKLTGKEDSEEEERTQFHIDNFRSRRSVSRSLYESSHFPTDTLFQKRALYDEYSLCPFIFRFTYSHRSVYKRENIQLRLFIYIHRIHPNLYIKYIVRRAKVRNDRFDKRK